jgi:phytoene desaturase
VSGGPVLVIGAGVGGLSAAIHLAAAGKQVHILEQSVSAGGKMAERRQGGFRWDIGPSVITMRDVLEDAFRAAGRRMEDHLSLLAMEPLTRYFYPDGGVLDVERSAEATARRLAELDPREGEAYLRYLAYAERLFRITSPAFIYGDPPGLHSLLRFSPLDLLGIDGLRTMDRSIGRRVFTAHLRQLLDRFATYVGADPYQAPATLNVIAHVELNQGVWFPVGGIYSIAQALTDAAEAMGVEIRLGTQVRRILTRGGEVVGVETDSGETLEAEAVVTDIDAAVVYGDLLPQQPGIRRMAERLRRRERSLSAYILLLGLEGTTPALAHHNLLFSSDYEAEFRSLFGLGATAEDPSLYISISARSNPADAPPGCENWFVLANAPADSERWRESGASEAYAGRLLEVLARRGFDPRPRMLERAWITPLDLERDTGAWRGALYGASSNGRLAAFRRAHNRSPVMRRLYLAGGTVHPGGGVPMAMLSGKAAARMLLQDFARGRR